MGRGTGDASPRAVTSLVPCLSSLLMNRHMGRRITLAFWVSALVAVPPLSADEDARSSDPPVRPAYISIIIDDLGNRRDLGRRALSLPGPVAYAILPHTPHGAELAEAAHAMGREVLLHQPMEAVEPGPLGPGALVLRSGHQGLVRQLDANLAAVPHAVGVNNHMGSQLTRHPLYMRWLMADLARRGGLYFVDSRTTAETLALHAAMEAGVPAVERDVFLDADPSPDSVRAELRRLMDVARRDGYALAIGHPHPVTLEVLEQELASLMESPTEAPVRLVSPSRLVREAERVAERREDPRWQKSSSHSPKVSKNSKP